MKENLSLFVYLIMLIVYLPKLFDSFKDYKTFFIKKRTIDASSHEHLKIDYTFFIETTLYLLGIVLVFLFIYVIIDYLISRHILDLIKLYSGPLVQGLKMTITISFLSILLGTALGFILAFIVSRTSMLFILFKPLTNSIIYILISVPALVFILLLSYNENIVSDFWVAIIALGINLSPFVAKIIGSSLQNIPKDQINAAKSFGFSSSKIFTKFTSTFVIRHSLQPLLVEYYTTIKLSSLIGYIGVIEVFHTTQDIIKDTQDPIDGYILLTICYIVLVIPFAFIADYLEKRLRNRQNSMV